MKKTHRICIAITALFVAIFMVISVFASDQPIKFNDVPQESEYYTAVTYYAERGIISGMNNGSFRPELPMDIDSWLSILAKLNHISARPQSTSLHWANIYAEGLRDAGFLSSTSDAYLDFLSQNTTSFIYDTIWKMAGIKTYPASHYGFDSTLDAGTTAMVMSGLISREQVGGIGALGRTSGTGTRTISRGDALNLLYAVTVEKRVSSIPADLTSYIPIETDEFCSESDISLLLSELKKLPNNQVALVLVDNYKYVIREDISDLIETTGRLLGYVDYEAQTVYLRRDSIARSAIHETGHVAEYHNRENSFSDCVAAYAVDQKVAVTFLDDYCLSNTAEYMAVAYDYYICHMDDTSAMSTMEELTPRTYTAVSDIVIQDYGFTTSQFLDIVCH